MRVCDYTCIVLTETCHVTFESDGDFEIGENVASQQSSEEASVKVLVQSDEDVNSVSISLGVGTLHRPGAHHAELDITDVAVALARLFMAALCNRAGHYIFALCFLSFFFLSSFFLP